MKVLLVIYDNGSYINEFPIGLGYIAAVLEAMNIEVVLYSQDVHHYSEEHLTQRLNSEKFDAVGVSVIAGYYQYRKLLKISAAIHNSSNRPEYYIIGGHGPTPEPEYFLKKTQADIVVMGEGEITTRELFQCLQNKDDLSSVKGIAFRDGERVVVTGNRELIQNIDDIRMPAYHLFPIEYYRLMRMPHSANTDFVMPVLSGRGCTFTCNFCYRMDMGFRPRSIDSILEELEYLKGNYHINYIAFYDELLMSSVPRTIEISEMLIKSKLHVKWACNGRLNYARPDVLKIMKESGCVFINYGIESMDDTALKNMNKKLNVKTIIRGIENTLQAGISPGYNIIFGNIGETREILNKGVDFLIKYDDGAQMRTIRPVTPYPGSPLYNHAIQKGLLKDVEDFYENKHLNSDLMAVNFTDLSEDEFYQALNEANKKLLENYFLKKKESYFQQTDNLYLKRDSSFRGFRQT